MFVIPRDTRPLMSCGMALVACCLFAAKTDAQSIPVGAFFDSNGEIMVYEDETMTTFVTLGNAATSTWVVASNPPPPPASNPPSNSGGPNTDVVGLLYWPGDDWETDEFDYLACTGAYSGGVHTDPGRIPYETTMSAHSPQPLDLSTYTESVEWIQANPAANALVSGAIFGTGIAEIESGQITSVSVPPHSWLEIIPGTGVIEFEARGKIDTVSGKWSVQIAAEVIWQPTQ